MAGAVLRHGRGLNQGGPRRIQERQSQGQGLRGDGAAAASLGRCL